MMTLTLLLLLALQEKAAAPSDADQAAAQKLIKDVFKAELAKSTPADKRLLAKKMIQQGRETKDDPATQFVLFREAQSLSAQTGDLTTALDAIDELAKRFTIDAVALRGAALASASRIAKSPEDFLAGAAAAIKIADAAVARDEFDAADKALSTGLAMAKKAQDASLAARFAAKTKETSELRTKFNGARKARETLAATPDDPAANAAVGRYLVLLKGNWAEGLPRLAKGSDEALRGPAAADLANPADPAAQNIVGDGWWDLGDKEPAAKDLLHERAAIWYTKAYPKLTGLSRTKSEKRIQEVQALKFAKGSWVNVTDPANFQEAGKAGESIDIKVKAGFQVIAKGKEFPKGEFDALTIHVALELAAKPRAFITLEKDRVSVAADCDTGSVGFVGKDNASLPWTWESQVKVDHAEDVTLTVVVSGSEYILYVDNLEKARLATKATGITTLGFNIQQGNATITAYKLRRVE